MHCTTVWTMSTSAPPTDSIATVAGKGLDLFNGRDWVEMVSTLGIPILLPLVLLYIGARQSTRRWRDERRERTDERNAEREQRDREWDRERTDRDAQWRRERDADREREIGDLRRKAYLAAITSTADLTDLANQVVQAKPTERDALFQQFRLATSTNSHAFEEAHLVGTDDFAAVVKQCIEDRIEPMVRFVTKVHLSGTDLVLPKGGALSAPHREWMKLRDLAFQSRDLMVNQATTELHSGTRELRVIPRVPKQPGP